MVRPVLYVVVGVVVLVAYLWYQRHNELFCVSLRDGKALVVRGRIPARLLGDFKDALRRAGVNVARIRAVKTQRGGRLVVSGGVDDGTVQQLRNIFGTYTVARLAAAPPIEKPTLGQVIGVAWLAWLIEGFVRRQ